MKKIFLISTIVITYVSLQAQITSDEDAAGRTGNRYIQSAVPFMTISPDARSAGMADVGVATSADVNSMHWNAAKLTSIKDGDGELTDYGVGLTYTPWLSKLIDDMSLNYLSGYKRLSKQEVIGVSLNYFDLGQMTFRNGSNVITGEKRPYELNLAVAYARQLSKPLSVSLGLKWIHSNLASGVALSNGEVAKAGNALAADIGLFYEKDVIVSAEPFHFAFGVNISNLGNKLTYTTKEQAYFIPTNLRIGTAITKEIDLYNKVTLAVDLNKLMVPTPPVYLQNTNGSDSLVGGERIIIEGQDASDKSLIGGVFGSFADAPGGAKEEFQEVMLSIALEYWYANAFAVRAGYFYESETKGNRKYLTLGVGLRYKKFGADFSYLIPAGGLANSPLRDTLRLSLMMNLQSKKVEGTPDITSSL